MLAVCLACSLPGCIYTGPQHLLACIALLPAGGKGRPVADQSWGVWGPGGHWRVGWRGRGSTRGGSYQNKAQGGQEGQKGGYRHRCRLCVPVCQLKLPHGLLLLRCKTGHTSPQAVSWHANHPALLSPAPRCCCRGGEKTASQPAELRTAQHRQHSISFHSLLKLPPVCPCTGCCHAPSPLLARVSLALLPSSRFLSVC